jgi:SNF2 family DNA or RNA helicase
MKKLKPYQKKSINFMLKNPSSGLFLDAGLGKTLSVLETFDILRKENVVDTLVVMAKLRICYKTWPEEIKKWKFPYSYSLLHGKDKEEKILTYKRGNIIIINYDGLPWFLKMLEKYKRRLKLGRMWLVLDESTKVKSTKTNRFRMLKKVLNKFDRRTILTGTPCPNTLIDLYGQIFMLDGGKALGTKTSFLNTHFYSVGLRQYQKFLPAPDAEKEIFNKIKKLVIRFDSSELNLPKKLIVDRKVTLDDKTLKAYKQLEKEFITLIENEPITAPSIGAAFIKLRQIVGGAVYDEHKKVCVIGNEKIEALTELIEELNGKPVLVAYEFKHELTRLMEAFPKAKSIGGHTTAKAANKIIDNWNAGNLQILFAHPMSVAHGLNLQAAPKASVVFFSHNFDLENYEQFQSRIYRQGRKGTVFVYRIIAEKTIDEYIISALTKKTKGQVAFLNLVKRGMLK